MIKVKHLRAKRLTGLKKFVNLYIQKGFLLKRVQKVKLFSGQRVENIKG